MKKTLFALLVAAITFSCTESALEEVTLETRSIGHKVGEHDLVLANQLGNEGFDYVWLDYIEVGNCSRNNTDVLVFDKSVHGTDITFWQTTAAEKTQQEYLDCVDQCINVGWHVHEFLHSFHGLRAVQQAACLNSSVANIVDVEVGFKFIGTKQSTGTFVLYINDPDTDCSTANHTFAADWAYDTNCFTFEDPPRSNNLIIIE